MSDFDRMDEYSWTQDEVKTLLQYKKLNYASKDIGDLINKSGSAVESKYLSLWKGGELDGPGFPIPESLAPPKIPPATTAPTPTSASVSSTTPTTNTLSFLPVTTSAAQSASAPLDSVAERSSTTNEAVQRPVTVATGQQMPEATSSDAGGSSLPPIVPLLSQTEPTRVASPVPSDQAPTSTTPATTSTQSVDRESIRNSGPSSNTTVVARSGSTGIPKLTVKLHPSGKILSLARSHPQHQPQSPSPSQPGSTHTTTPTSPPPASGVATPTSPSPAPTAVTTPMPLVPSTLAAVDTIPSILHTTPLSQPQAPLPTIADASPNHTPSIASTNVSFNVAVNVNVRLLGTPQSSTSASLGPAQPPPYLIPPSSSPTPTPTPSLTAPPSSLPTITNSNIAHQQGPTSSDGASSSTAATPTSVAAAAAIAVRGPATRIGRESPNSDYRDPGPDYEESLDVAGGANRRVETITVLPSDMDVDMQPASVPASSASPLLDKTNDEEDDDHSKDKDVDDQMDVDLPLPPASAPVQAPQLSTTNINVDTNTSMDVETTTNNTLGASTSKPDSGRHSPRLHVVTRPMPMPAGLRTLIDASSSPSPLPSPAPSPSPSPAPPQALTTTTDRPSQAPSTSAPTPAAVIIADSFGTTTSGKRDTDVVMTEEGDATAPLTAPTLTSTPTPTLVPTSSSSSTTTTKTIMPSSLPRASATVPSTVIVGATDVQITSTAPIASEARPPQSPSSATTITTSSSFAVPTPQQQQQHNVVTSSTPNVGVATARLGPRSISESSDTDMGLVIRLDESGDSIHQLPPPSPSPSPPPSHHQHHHVQSSPTTVRTIRRKIVSHALPSTSASALLLLSPTSSSGSLSRGILRHSTSSQLAPYKSAILSQSRIRLSLASQSRQLIPARRLRLATVYERTDFRKPSCAARSISAELQETVNRYYHAHPPSWPPHTSHAYTLRRPRGFVLDSNIAERLPVGGPFKLLPRPRAQDDQDPMDMDIPLMDNDDTYMKGTPSLLVYYQVDSSASGHLDNNGDHYNGSHYYGDTDNDGQVYAEEAQEQEGHIGDSSNNFTEDDANIHSLFSDHVASRQFEVLAACGRSKRLVHITCDGIDDLAANIFELFADKLTPHVQRQMRIDYWDLVGLCHPMESDSPFKGLPQRLRVQIVSIDAPLGTPVRAD